MVKAQKYYISFEIEIIWQIKLPTNYLNHDVSM